MKLVTFIDKVGIKNLALKAGVTPRTVYRWRVGELMASNQMLYIHRLSKGLVTYGDMFKHHLDNQ